jgi:hypothetical protein
MVALERRELATKSDVKGGAEGFLDDDRGS